MKKLFGMVALSAILAFSIGYGVAFAVDAAKTIVSGDIHYFQNEVRLNGATKIGTSALSLTYAGTIAASGPTGASGTALSYTVNGVTATTGGLSVTLPTAAKGLVRIVGNKSASTVSLYPYTGDAINAAAADSALSMATSKAYTCTAMDTTTWLCAGN
jgi:hypothetical protein